MAALLRLLPYLKPYRLSLLGLVALMGVSSALELLKPWPLKIAIDNILEHEPLELLGWRPIEGLSPRLQTLAVAGFMLAVTLATSLVHLASSYVTTRLGQDIVRDFRFDCFDHLQRQSPRFHQHYSIADLTYRLMGDTYAVQYLFLNVLITVVWNLLFLIGVAVVLIRLDPLLTACALSVIPLFLASIFFFGRRLENMAVEVYQRETRVGAILEQIFYALPLVQAYCGEAFERTRFTVATGEAFDKRLRHYCLQSAYNGLVGTIAALGSGLVLFVGIVRVAENALSAGGLFVFVSYLASLYGPVSSLSFAVTSYRASVGQAKRVFELINADESVPVPANAPPLRVERGAIRFEEVGFSYDGRRPTLRQVDLYCPPGCKLALIGPTGSGKTTLAHLLLRFYDPRQGRILVDGQDIRAVGLKSLRDQIAVVLQDTYLFPTTVRENILYGRRNATLEEVMEAAHIAGAHEFIQNLPQGYDTALGERGADLSGGQRQRLSIARAVLRNAPILILDEPTSALDIQTEEAIMANLDRLMAQRTTIMIAHRQSLIQRADLVAVLKDGQVADIGSCRELAARRSEFRTFLNLPPRPDSRAAH
jgi:ATP-binding cassette subfamily B protein